MKTVMQIFTVSMSVKFIEGLSEKLRKEGYKLVVLCADGPEVQNDLLNNYYEFYPIEMARGISIIKNMRAWKQMYIRMKEIRPDIVHGNTPVGGLFSMTVAFVLGIHNRVFTLHGLKYPGEKGLKKILVKYFEKLSLYLATEVYAVSEGLKEYAIKERLVKESKIKVLHHGSVKGIDIQEAKDKRDRGRCHYENLLGLQTGVYRIGYFGRITEEKGIKELMNALSDLAACKFKFEGIFCGTLELEPENAKLFDTFCQNEYVMWFNQVDNPLDYMMCCDCVVLPTYREGFGLVNIEANSLGVPVVTTDVMGCKDSIEDGKTGVFCKVADCQDLRDKLLYLYDNKNIRKTMGVAGIKRVEQLFDRNEIWGKLIEEYDKLTEESQG